MEFHFEPELRAYMKEKGLRTILVEMVEINNSDLDVSELNIRFPNARIREQFITKKNYRFFETEVGEVLLPRFPLQMDEVITFGLKKVLFFHKITCKGIKL